MEGGARVVGPILSRQRQNRTEFVGQREDGKGFKPQSETFDSQWHEAVRTNLSPTNRPAGRASTWRYTLQGVASLLWVVQAWWLAGALAALLAYAQGAAQDVTTGEQARAALVAAPWAELWYAAGVVVLAGVLRAALEYAGARATYGWARAQLTALRQAFAARLRATSPLDARRPSSGQLASAWVEQAEAVVPWLARYRAAQWRVMVVAPVVLVCVAMHTWVAALLLALAAPLIPLFMALVGWRAQAISERQMLVLGHLHGHLLERLRGLPTLRALHAVDSAAARLTQLGETVARQTMRVLRVAMLSSAVLELFSALGVALVAVYVGFHLLGQLPFGAWGERMSLHQGLFVLMLAPSFFEPLRELSAVWHDRANGLAAQRTLAHLLQGLTPLVQANEADDADQATGAGDMPPAQGLEADEAQALQGPAPSVALCGVMPTMQTQVEPSTQAAPVQEPAAMSAVNAAQATRQPWHIDIPAGAHVALTGPSGSGKSTLLALVAGLVQPQQGQVRIGGVPLHSGTVARLRRAIGWLGQPPHFLAGSLERNLYLGRDIPASPVQARAALRDAGLAALADRMAEVRLGEGGSGISGGEALRLALARLAVAESTRLLLLDEPTAHLDAATAAQVRASVARLAQGKTLLVATHDPELAASLPYELNLDAQGQAQWLRRPAQPEALPAEMPQGGQEAQP